MSTPDTEDLSASWSFETKQIHAGQSPDAGHARPGPADLPDHVLHLRQHRPRRRAVRAGRAGQHLHPDHEPDPGHASSSASPHSRAVSRRCSWPPVRPRRPSRSSTSPARATTSCPARGSTAAPTTCCTTPCPSWASRPRSSRTPTTWTPGRRRSGRTPRRSSPRRSPTRKIDILDIAGRRRGRPRERRAADRGQHHRHAVPDPADRPRAPTSSCTRPRSTSAATAPRSRGVIVDSGNFDWTDSGSFPGFTDARPELPRRGLRRPRRAGLRPQGPRAAAARPRFGGLAVQRLPGRPGTGDAEPAHRAARRQRPAGRRVARGPRRRGVGQLRGAAQLAVARAGEEAGAQGNRRGAVLRARRWRRGGQGVRRRAQAAQPRGQHR